MASPEQSSSGFVTTTAEPGVGHSAASPFSNGTVRQHRYTPPHSSIPREISTCGSQACPFGWSTAGVLIALAQFPAESALARWAVCS